jgi:hypothetical protein
MKRDLRLDTFRGLFLVWMALNHLGGPLHPYLFQSLGFISSAEPFVFISGVTAGMVYGRIGLHEGVSKLRQRAFRRGLDIYLFHLAVFVLVIILEWTITTPMYHTFYVTMNPLPLESPLTALGLGATLLLQPGFLDILPMYSLFLLITPLVINRLKSPGGYGWVFGVSIPVWALTNYTDFWDRLQKFGAQFLPLNLGFFDPLAWQFLFVAGLFFGFRRAAGMTFPVNKPLIILSLIVCLGILPIRYGLISVLPFGIDPGALTVRETFGPLRVINMAALAYLVTCLGIRFPNCFEWPFFSFLGQHSLKVFSFHVALLYLIRPLYGLVIPLGWTAILLFNFLFIGTLAIPAWLHIRYRVLVERQKPA